MTVCYLGANIHHILELSSAICLFFFTYCQRIIRQTVKLGSITKYNLDSKKVLEVMQLLTQLNQEGTTVLMVTHSERDAGYAQRIINLLDGQVVPEVIL